MSDSETCERCGAVLPEVGVLRGTCPRCLLELGLAAKSEIGVTAVTDNVRSMVGRQLGHYQLVALIGAGGMGAVWRATDSKLGRQVAIKTVPKQFVAIDRLLRFEREAKILASLNHPNIASIYEFEEDQGTPFLVMELVEGVTLEDRLRNGTMPLQESLKLARQISAALEVAHDKGVAHRDLKPANVKITEDGTVKVLDFGLAKVLAAHDVEGDSQHSVSQKAELTEQGMILGTAAYMAPEQARGMKADRRVDIWAFGVVLYEMVAGTRPFQGADAAETMASVVTAEPDFNNVPIHLRRLLKKCLQKDPKNRLRDIGDVWELVDDASTDNRQALQRRIWRDAKVAWIVASVLGIVALVMAFGWPKTVPQDKVVRFQIHAPHASRLPLGTPAISNDGTTLAYTVVDSEGIARIHLRAIDGLESKPLRGTEGAIHPFWSDGESLAFMSGFQLKVINLPNESVRDLHVSTSNQWQGAANQRDDILVYHGRELNQISANGGDLIPIPNSSAAGFPMFLSDGQRFLIYVQGEKNNSIQLAGLRSAERTIVMDNVSSAPVLARTPLGKTYLLFLRESDLMAQQFDEVSGKVYGSPVVFIQGIGRVNRVLPAVGISPNGILAYQIADQVITKKLQWVDRFGLPIRALPSEVFVQRPRLSPNESLVVGSSESDSADIWVTDLIKGSSERKTFDKTRELFPVWSKDGSRIAFLRSRSGIYVIDSDGSGPPKLLSERQGSPTSWSNKYLMFSFPLLPQDSKIYLLDLSGNNEPIQVGSPNGKCITGEFSPDGNYIAFASDRSGRYEVYVQPIPPRSGETRVSVNGGALPRWRGDGQEIFFVSLDGDLMAADIKLGKTVSVDNPHKLFRFDAVDGSAVMVNGYDVARNGQRFLVVSETGQENAPITVVLNWWIELESRFGR